MFDDCSTSELIVMQVDGQHQPLLVSATDRDGHRIDEGSINKNAFLPANWLEYTGQGIGCAHGFDQRACREPDFMTCAQFGADGNKRPVEIFETQTIKVFAHTTIKLHATEKSAAAQGYVQKIEHAPSC